MRERHFRQRGSIERYEQPVDTGRFFETLYIFAAKDKHRILRNVQDLVGHASKVPPLDTGAAMC